MTETTHPDDIEQLAEATGESPVTTVDIGGATPIEIRPLKVGKLPPFARALRPMLPELAGLMSDEGLSAGDLVGLIADHGDDLFDAVAIGAGIDRDAIIELEIDHLLELAAAVLKVNMDFFTQRLTPALSQVAKTMARQAEAAGSAAPNA